MKLVLYNDDIVIYLNKYIYSDLNFDTKKNIQNQLKDLFLKIETNYNIKINGYYNVSIYIDDNYGSIISMKKEELDYIDYDDDQVDMRIVIINCTFLYKIDDIFYDSNLTDCIKYKDNYYLKIRNKLNNIEMGHLLEHSIIVYDKTNEIIKYGVVLKREKNVV